jgi:2-keto-3-deoxy-L-rhamnonate aldolase RhmA
MRANRARRLLELDRPIYCVTVEFPEPRLVEYVGLLGFDMVHIDGEHHGVSVETCYHLVRAADAVGMASMVRVPVNRPEVLMEYAETGVDVITAPHVRSRADAESLVEALNFPPRGIRGLSAYSRAANYGATQHPIDYYDAVAERTMPMALLEDVEAYDTIDDLATVDGLELYALGLSDLSGSLSIPGQTADPRVRARRDHALQVLRRQGKVVAIAADGVEALAGLRADGAGIIMSSARAILERGCREILAEAGLR